MASLEYVRLTPRRPEVVNGQVRWVKASGEVIDRLPQLVWESHSTWAEVNIWALECARSKDIATVCRSMYHMLAYANWLEHEGIGWWHFPARESDRCLKRFRGALIRGRDGGEIAPSTTSARMSTVVQFYRWLQREGLLSTAWPKWTERQVGIRLTDGFGFEHMLRVASTDLAIPNTKVAGAIELEDGVMPLTGEGLCQVLDLSAAKASEELDLILRIGFGTGLRLGSILDLKLATIELACIDPVVGWYRLAVGPGARPPVATKFGMSGMVPIPTPLLKRLREYAYSARRLKRQAKATPSNEGLLFLTRFGNPYSALESRAINVEMWRLRTVGKRLGVSVLRDFHFHRTRATFATMLMRAALKTLPVGEAIQFVREACLHKEEATTLKYVKFIESNKAMAEAADAFTEAFMGLAGGARHA